ncbi:MAG TPA: hypothetical protein VGO67_25390 [Verrucomicrobiae bacterium]|jgi:predicted nucleic acid-binding protein
MIWLLDVSTLLAWLWQDHEHHDRVLEWSSGKPVATCPFTDLGFLRISTQPVFGATVSQAREMLADWHHRARPKHLPCDLRALDSAPASGGAKTTDYYLASLAAKHRMKWATLDENVVHPAAFVVPAL